MEARGRLDSFRMYQNKGEDAALLPWGLGRPSAKQQRNILWGTITRSARLISVFQQARGISSSMGLAWDVAGRPL